MVFEIHKKLKGDYFAYIQHAVFGTSEFLIKWGISDSLVLFVIGKEHADTKIPFIPIS
jgi:hypothetical protein